MADDDPSDAVSLEDYVSPHLLCPISHSLMDNPVVAPSGHTYDADSIRTWLQKNPVDPLNRKPLSAVRLYPNRAIQDELIAQLEKLASRKSRTSSSSSSGGARSRSQNRGRGRGNVADSTGGGGSGGGGGGGGDSSGTGGLMAVVSSLFGRDDDDDAGAAAAAAYSHHGEEEDELVARAARRRLEAIQKRPSAGHAAASFRLAEEEMQRVVGSDWFLEACGEVTAWCGKLFWEQLLVFLTSLGALMCLVMDLKTGFPLGIRAGSRGASSDAARHPPLLRTLFHLVMSPTAQPPKSWGTVSWLSLATLRYCLVLPIFPTAIAFTLGGFWSVVRFTQHVYQWCDPCHDRPLARRIWVQVRDISSVLTAFASFSVCSRLCWDAWRRTSVT
mmetsp:Transcript_19839/g.43073  ORF Transcript_19839/g.43073 Transcript_19839/m.43073 type:complete len:387 (+) Transcript_19839:260-1420(+)